jgi:hypothetical protein
MYITGNYLGKILQVSHETRDLGFELFVLFFLATQLSGFSSSSSSSSRAMLL